MSIRIGESRLPGDFARYARRFSFVEIDTEPGRIPSKARLRAAAAEAPEGFTFSVVVPGAVAALESGEEAERELKRAQGVAELVRAQWFVVRTPASVRPTRRAREQLAALCERLSSGGQRIAWEPAGLWDDAAAAEVARELGVHLVRDIAREAPPAATTLYSRILALGRGVRVGLGLAGVVAERLEDFEEAFVVVEGRGAVELARACSAVAQEQESERADALTNDARPPASPGFARSRSAEAPPADELDDDEDIDDDELDDDDADELDDDDTVDDDELDDDDTVDDDELDDDDEPDDEGRER